MMDSEQPGLPRSYVPVDPELSYDEHFIEGASIKISNREHPDATASFAMELLRTNGVLMGDENGEDSSGRAKLRPMAPHLLVDRAFDIAEQAYEVARTRGHMLLLPTKAEATAFAEQAKDDAERRKQERRERETAARAAAKATADA